MALSALWNGGIVCKISEPACSDTSHEALGKHVIWYCGTVKAVAWLHGGELVCDSSVGGRGVNICVSCLDIFLFILQNQQTGFLKIIYQHAGTGTGLTDRF